MIDFFEQSHRSRSYRRAPRGILESIICLAALYVQQLTMNNGESVHGEASLWHISRQLTITST